MPFITDILPYKSLSIVGLEKNTGKTVCLNYVLSRLHELNKKVAVTSIGIDGERIDQVYGSAKPEIVLYEGMQFITSEKHYRQRNLLSNILQVDNTQTALGRLVTAEVLCEGKVLLSGAATTEKLRSQITYFTQQGRDITIIDGALSRLSLASPTVTDAMLLATGAVVSPNIRQLILKTRFIFNLINLQEVADPLRFELSKLKSGLWAVDGDGELHDLKVPSVFLLSKSEQNIFQYGTVLYVSGAITDKLLTYLAAQKQIRDIILVVRDFTKIFVSPEVYSIYCKKGGRLRVLQKSKLIAVCVNPTSPQGYTLDSKELCARLSENLQMPVWDVRNI